VRRFWVIFLPAAVYQFLAIFAALRHLVRRRREQRNLSSRFCPGVSVLKPVYGLDPNTSQAFRSQIQQEYPQYELLFGIRRGDDPSAAEIRRLQAEFPDVPIRLVVGGADTPNGKAGVLMELARQARYPVQVVNDSDIKVTPAYLREVVAPLGDPSVGLVTCLYRATAGTVAGAWEALGIATDFMPSTLVAQLVGVREFGLGSTLAFRADDLEQAGGFGEVADYLADDYQIGKCIARLGKRVVVSTYTVETSVGDSTWAGIWRHQLRWARTIRFSKGAGYAGLPIAHAGLWITIALVTGAWVPAAILAATRIASAVLTGWFVLCSGIAGKFCWLAPVSDLYAFAVWLASYAGNQVRWRDQTLTIDREGRIRRKLP
jgi:ceramide glucosyltransferase